MRRAPHIAAIVLAAGTSSRMGSNKLLADLGGAPLIRRTVEAVASWLLKEIIVVTGHEADKVAGALEGTDTTRVHNANYAQGLSTSLRRGLDALSKETEAVLVCLGDMPLVEVETVQRLIAAFDHANHHTICVPVHKNTRGNPVLWGRGHFAAMAALKGDRGAKGLMKQLNHEVVEIETVSAGILMDADTPEALLKIRETYLSPQ